MKYMVQKLKLVAAFTPAVVLVRFGVDSGNEGASVLGLLLALAVGTWFGYLSGHEQGSKDAMERGR